jgi:trk system potassium uptake protein TrkA
MKIVILGAGGSGCYAASVLAQEQHDVTLIDHDPKALDQVNRETDVATMLSVMPNAGVLWTLLENKPDLFCALTGDDETNLVSSSMAKNLGFPKTVARIQSHEYLQSDFLHVGRLFHVDHLIGAEMLSAQDLFKLLAHGSDSVFRHFANGSVLMRSILVPDGWTKGDVPIQDLRLPIDLIVGLIRRKTLQGELVLYPHGADKIEPGDEVTLIGESTRMNELHEIFQISEKRIKSVILVGGSTVSLHLARLLLQQKISVKIIEKDAERSRILADLLPRATIVNRDGKDPWLLTEENVESCDALVLATQNDGENYLISSMALHLGCPKVISLVSNPAYLPLFEKLKIITAPSARVNMTDRLLAIIHESSFRSVVSLSNESAKIVELKVSPTSQLLGVPFAKLRLPKDLLIPVIENHGKVMIGHGESILCPDDTVIAICSNSRLEQLHQLFH